ncbi:hypothetical protein [Nonlabens antarcticus]|uniref:hypothetical protein n=1 Tax=Nonlabens antarcticus TaxID=392714 RepID=UPI001891C269|nr:hypothetical protein [Nonlabens antarcticus]
MAEIKIEKKKPIWPWILLAAIVLAIILYFVFLNNDDDATDDDITTEQVMEDDAMDVDNGDMNTDAMASYDAALTKYSNFIGTTGEMGIDHEYSHTALALLASAVEAKADVLNVDVSADLDQVRKNADAITKQPYELNHADLIKEAGESITRALETIQTDKYPNLSDELAQVEKDVANIEKEKRTLKQKGTVNGFYQAAEDLLNKMN